MTGDTRSAATPSRWRWLLGWIGPLCLGLAAFTIFFWDSSGWIVVALLVGAFIGRYDPWNIYGRRQ